MSRGGRTEYITLAVTYSDMVVFRCGAVSGMSRGKFVRQFYNLDLFYFYFYFIFFCHKARIFDFTEINQKLTRPPEDPSEGGAGAGAPQVRMSRLRDR